MESVSGMSSMGSSRGGPDEDVVRGGSSEDVLVRLAKKGLEGSMMCRDRSRRSALYRLRSRCVAFISVPCGDSAFGHTFSAASSEYDGGIVMRTSYRVLFIARIESVVHAIQPQPCSLREYVLSESGVVAAALDARRSSSRNGMSWTPIEKRGRSL